VVYFFYFCYGFWFFIIFLRTFFIFRVILENTNFVSESKMMSKEEFASKELRYKDPNQFISVYEFFTTRLISKQCFDYKFYYYSSERVALLKCQVGRRPLFYVFFNLSFLNYFLKNNNFELFRKEIIWGLNRLKVILVFKI
jgi:hypothetical protein